jgi:hypothetical protein
VSIGLRRVMLPSPSRLRARPPGLLTFGATSRSLALRPERLAPTPRVGSSRGFSAVGCPPACPPSYGASDSYPGRSPSPAEHISLSWTHNRTCKFPRIRLKHWPTHSRTGGTRLPALALAATGTLRRESRQRNRRKPHRQGPCAPPTSRHRFLKSVGSRFTYANTRGKSAGFRRGVILPGGATPLRPVTGRPSLAPSSCTRRPISSSYELPSGHGGRRAYHVPPRSRCGLGRASPPVAQRLRQGSSEPPDLATDLLVRACQHLTLGITYGV